MKLLLILGILMLSIGAFIGATGYILFKINAVNSIEEGIRIGIYKVSNLLKSICRILKVLGSMLGNWLYEEFTGTPLIKMEEQEDLTLILYDDEPNDFVHTFADHPYDTPILGTIPVKANGIYWIEIAAAGIIPKYRGIANEDLRKLAVNLVQCWYQNNRQKIGVPVYIKLITAKRLVIAIPLSVKGREFLERQEVNRFRSENEFVERTFEEEIPEDTRENSDDHRI